MRKLLIGSLLLFGLVSYSYADQITVDAFISADSITIAHIENFRSTVVDAINNGSGTNIATGSIPHTALDANSDPVNRWNEAFNDFVYTGLTIPTTSGTLTSTTTSGTAYITGMRVVKDATAKAYTASKYTFVDLSSNGTYTYQETVVGAADPSVTSDSIRLARVTSSGTEITAVRDDRVTGVQLSTSEDFTIKGFEISTDANTNTVTVDSGVLYVGATRINKTAQTAIYLGTAGDWWDGVTDSYAGGAGWAYIAVDNSGNIKFIGANAPDYHSSVSATTAGKKYYWYDTSIPEYWRVIHGVRVNTSNNINQDYMLQSGSFVTWNVPVSVATAASSSAWSSAVSCSAGIPATSTMGIFGIGVVGGASPTAIWLRPNASTWAIDKENGLYHDAVPSGGIGSWRTSMTDSSQQIQYYSAGTTTSVAVDVEGFVLNLRD